MMKVNITIRDEELKKGFENYREKINEKIDKLGQFADELHNARLVVDKSGINSLAEFSIHSRGKEFYAKSKKKVLQESLNSVIDKVERQLKKEADKHTTRRHKANGS
ncbi:MAG: HPF/RaiA family ribosome-associated protein [bacterium]